MDGQDYLNQISAQARPEKKSKLNFMNSPIFKVSIGGIIALILIVIIGSILTSSSGGIKSRSISLKYHIDNTLNIISTYQPDIKSSDLRSSSASLYSVLSNTSRELTDYLIGNFNYADGSETYQTDFENASMNSAILESDLFNAKINGILDKVYASKMAYEISSIMSEENTIYDSTDDAYFQSILSASYQSLETLYPNFNN